MNDDDRYIEYLQQQLLSDGYDMVFKNQDSAAYLARLRSISKSKSIDYSEMLNNLEREIQEFAPRTTYDDFFTKKFFNSKLDQVKKAAQVIGVPVEREIVLENSTSATPSPDARPSDGWHLLFAGHGTMSFCNYWAKAITAIVKEYPLYSGLERIESEQPIIECFRRSPDLLLECSRLALHYGCYSSLLGYGELIESEGYAAYRSQLLDAMETFIISHEVSHFIAEERFGNRYKGIISPELSHELEYFCDEMGLQLCRECSSRDNWLSFCGVGALTFFSMYHLCEETYNLITEKLETIQVNANPTRNSISQNSHPPLVDRITNLRELIVSKTEVDQRETVASFFDEYKLILSVIHEQVIDTIKTVIDKPLKS